MSVQGFAADPTLTLARCAPYPSSSEIDACQFQSWFPKFKDLSIKSRVIQVPEVIREWLLSGIFALPAEFFELPLSPIRLLPNETEGAHHVGLSDFADESSVPDLFNQKETIDFIQSINREIQNLQGKVMVKLNWSSPKDAVWMTFNSLRCTSVGDILTQIKSSDAITHDLLFAYNNCKEGSEGEGKRRERTPERLVLVLRKWYDIALSLEFRCFVHQGHVIAISQRHTETFFPFLQQHHVQDNIKRTTLTFFYEEVVGRDAELDSSCVMDVCLNRNQTRVRIVDFNPWSGITDSLLFSWTELAILSTKHSKDFKDNERSGDCGDSINAGVVERDVNNENPELRVAQQRDCIRSLPFNSAVSPNSHHPSDFSTGSLDGLLTLIEEQRKQQKE